MMLVVFNIIEMNILTHWDRYFPGFNSPFCYEAFLESTEFAFTLKCNLITTYPLHKYIQAHIYAYMYAYISMHALNKGRYTN